MGLCPAWGAGRCGACFTSPRPVLYSGALCFSGEPYGRGSIDRSDSAARGVTDTLYRSPPPPHAYNPGFSRAVTLLSAIVLSASIMVVAWLSFDVPRIERVPDAERALSHMVGRLMDQEEGLKTLPVWEQVLYDLTMGSDANDREQAIEWYRELAEESSDPFVDLHLAILQGESGQLPEITRHIVRWSRQGEPYPSFSRLLQAAYVDAHVPPPVALNLQAYLAEQPVAGWFYTRLATRIAERAGDRPLLLTIEHSSQQRVETLVRRSRAFAWLELALMCAGLVVLWVWIRRGRRSTMFRVGSAELPPLWAGRLGAGVLLRGGAVGALLTVAFLFAASDLPSLRVVAVPLSNLPLLALAYYHLLRPQRQTFWRGFGLSIQPRHLGQLALAALAVVAAGLVGEWVLGRIAEPLKLISHWTEWFDADLVWGLRRPWWSVSWNMCVSPRSSKSWRSEASCSVSSADASSGGLQPC